MCREVDPISPYSITVFSLMQRNIRFRSHLCHR
ncbi:Uncharacterised protein [Vibrio cholerae]|nr:Uncharacterised protein [Vibrio cholerae]CSC79496.1 Uncharacterised protein [Vibrio cholerae]